MTTPELLISPHGLPERVFGLGPVTVDGRCAAGSMRGEPWMGHDDGRPAAGALGVVLDVVVGQPTLSARPDGTWPVTTELSIDLVRPPDGGDVTVRGELVVADDAVAVTRGVALAGDGSPLAEATARTRYTPGVPDLAAAEALDADGPRTAVTSAASLRAAFGAELDADARRLVVPPAPAMLNAARNVHGGVIVCLADVLATAAWTAPDVPPLTTASIRAVYLRPGSSAGPLELTAHVRHRGRSTALVDVDVVGADGRVCALVRVAGTAPG